VGIFSVRHHVLALVSISLALVACGGATSESSQVSSRSASKGGARTAAVPVVQHPAAGGFKPDGTTIDSCKPEGFTCFEQAFGNLAYREGPTAAIDLVSRMLGENVAAVRDDCHTILHSIGSATLARFEGDAAGAMGLGSMVCGSGYYHGLIEYALKATRTEKQLVAKVVGMCSDRASLNTAFLLYQCVHGLGHGLMIFSGLTLPWALSMCSKLDGEWMQRSCSGGVFMQNFNLPSKLSPFTSRFVSKKNLLYPCDWVSDKYKYYCYLQITEHILYSTNYDWKKAASECVRAGSPWTALCFQSYGRDATGQARYKPDGAYDLCRLTGSHLADCVFGAARDFANNDVNGRRAAEFCALVPTRIRGFCFYGIGTILVTFGHDASWLARTCRSLTPSYAAQCAGRLTAREYAMVTPIPAA
jgi:hypothetical protein